MTDKNSGVLVVVEVAESQPVDLGLEMLGLARQLTDGVGGAVTAVAFGAGLENIGEILISHGADQVLVNDNTIFADAKPYSLKYALPKATKYFFEKPYSKTDSWGAPSQKCFSSYKF